MNVTRFLELIAQNVARVKRYVNGGDGTGGECDCIGLIIGALRMGGVKWPWTHGSNYTARNRMRWMKRITALTDLKLGQLVYKAHEPGADGWKLPSTYKGHPDQRDYYHVGVVTSIDPVVITNCTGVAGGIQKDKTLDGGEWNWYGEIDLVEYEEGGSVENQIMYVTSENGGPVKLRMNANKNAGWYDQLPVGTRVEVLPWVNAEWYKVYVDGQYGYMMKEFLTLQPPDGVLVVADDVHLILTRETAEKLKNALEEALK